MIHSRCTRALTPLHPPLHSEAATVLLQDELDVRVSLCQRGHCFLIKLSPNPSYPPSFSWQAVASVPTQSGKNLIDIGADGAEQNEQNKLDNNVGGSAGLFQRVLQFHVHLRTRAHPHTCTQTFARERTAFVREGERA